MSTADDELALRLRARRDVARTRIVHDIEHMEAVLDSLRLRLRIDSPDAGLRQTITAAAAMIADRLSTLDELEYVLHKHETRNDEPPSLVEFDPAVAGRARARASRRRT